MGTINFVLVGARNTGKTCYLAVLARHCSGVTTASDDTTLYLKSQSSLLDAGELPAATASSFRELKFQYVGNGRKLNFSIDDYDGSFIESLSRSQTEDDLSRSALKDRIKECEGLMFFMPHESTHDEKKLADFEDEVSTIVQLIEDVTGGKYASLPIPVCICVTKWDRSKYFQAADEKEQALIYIDSIPAYQRTLAKLKILFDDVKVFPISAFGGSIDGRHPIKDRVEPYKLESPIDYCLDRLYPRYDQKIAEMQQRDDELGLLDYLCELYDDLQHHKDGAYCKLYDELEQKFSTQLIEEISSNVSQEVLDEDQKYIYNALRSASLRTSIDQTLTAHQSKRKMKAKGVWAIAAAFVIVAIAGGVYYNNQEVRKQNTIKAQTSLDSLMIRISDESISLGELVPQLMKERKNCQKFVGKDCKKAIDATEEKARMLFKTQLDLVKKTPDPNIIKQLHDLAGSMDSWPNQEFVQVMKDKIVSVDTSYDLLQNLRRKKETVVNMHIKDYQSVKNQVAAASVQWPEMNELLSFIFNSIRSLIKADAKEAMNLANLDDLESSSDQLTMLRDIGDKQAGELLAKLTPVKEAAVRKQAMEEMLSEISQKLDVDKIAKVIHEGWVKGFDSQDKHRLAKLLQQKYEEYETMNLPSDDNIASKEQLSELENKINKVNSATARGVNVGDFTYRYKRPSLLQKRVKLLELKRAKYQRALDHGVTAYVTFMGNGSDDAITDPLGFNCTANDHDLALQIDGAEYPEELFDHCTNNSMKLRSPIYFKPGLHSIKAFEHDSIVFNDVWGPTSFFIGEKQLFELLNSKRVVISIAPYNMMLSIR